MNGVEVRREIDALRARLNALETRLGDIERSQATDRREASAERRRIASEQAAELRAMTAGVEQHIARLDKTLRHEFRQELLDAIAPYQDTLQEARDELVKLRTRREIEEENERKAAAKAKADLEIRKTDADIQIQASEAKTRKWSVPLTVLGTIAAALIAACGATCASQWPQITKQKP